MPKLKDLTGEKFGDITILKRDNSKKRVYWKYKCVCGIQGSIRGDRLKNKILKCFHKEDLSGQQFGRWLVIKEVESQGKYRAWLCECQCENKTRRVVLGMNLKSNKSRSCGCISIENKTTHNMSNKRIYNIYRGIIARCNNPNHRDYHNYGGRGIKVYKEWLNKKNGFMNFYNWAMNNGYKENLTTERKDVNGNYEPNNCIWITIEEQQLNKRNTIKVEYNGKTKNLSVWAKELGFRYNTLEYRYKQGKRGLELFKEVIK